MTKYDTASIMKRAHDIRREGNSMSEGMKQAWAEARLKNIDSELFLLKMKDRWNDRDRQLNDRLSKERVAIAAAIRSKPATRKATPKAAPVEKTALTAEERKDLKDRMANMWLNMATFDMAVYKALEASLYTTVAA